MINGTSNKIADSNHRTDGTDFPGRMFVPATNFETPVSGAVVLLHDADGIDSFALSAAEKIAGWGYVVSAPDLFAACPPPGDGDRQEYLLSLSDSHIIKQVISAVDTLALHPKATAGKIALVGWGWSGAYALMAAAHDGRVAATADIGGIITYPIMSSQKPGSPLNFIGDIEGAIFAAFAGGDPHFPAHETERVRMRLIEHDKRGEVKVYEGAPARFWSDPRRPDSARLWRRLQTFLKENLSPSEDTATDMGEANEESRLHATT